MRKSFKEQSSDSLIKQAVDIIDELADRGVNFLQSVIDTYSKLKKDAAKVKQIIKDTKSKKEG